MTTCNRIPSSKISAVVSDVDGTLVTDEKVLTERAELAVAELHASGVIFGVISARPPGGLLMLRGPLQITTPVIGFNGGVLTDPDMTIVTEHLLSPETARRAVDLLDAHGAQVWVFSGQEWLLRDADQPYVALEQRTVGFRPTIVEEFGSILDAAAKIVGVSRDFALLARCEHDAATALAGRASVVRSQSYYVDITHPLANKGVALSEFAKLLGIPLAEIAVIGDGSNDVAMFEKSGLSIAMGNAKPEVRQAADFITDSNREDGFANAIEQFILGGHRSNAPTKARSRRSPRMTVSARATSKIALFLADADDALLASEKVPSSQAAMAVKDLLTAGMRLRSRARRSPRGMALLINSLGLRTPIAGFNGGVFVKTDLSVIESYTLDPVVTKATLSSIIGQELDEWVDRGALAAHRR